MKRSSKKVMVFGVFDLLHPGHLDFLKQARKLGDYLVVSVARDKNAEKYKGYPPVFNENERMKDLKPLMMVDKVVLGDKNNPWKHIMEVRPDIIALGYDQDDYVDNLQDGLKERKLKTKIVRVKAFKPARYKSKKIRERIKHGKPL